MAETIKVLAQSKPLATTLTDIYTAPGSGAAVVSSIVVCNQSASQRTFRISIAVSGLADTTKQYIYYDQRLDANSTFIATIGTTLGVADVVRVYASAADLSFTLFGSEVT